MIPALDTGARVGAPPGHRALGNGAASGVEKDGCGCGGGGGGGGGGSELRKSVSNSRAAEYWREFELPREDPLTQPPSPDAESAAPTRRESTVADTDEPRSSPMSVSGGRASGRGGRGGRASARAGGGGSARLSSRLQNELETPKGERSASRRTSKAPSIVEQEQDEDKVMEDADEDDDDDDDEEAEQEESTPAEEEDEEDESEEHEEEEAEQKRSKKLARAPRSRPQPAPTSKVRENQALRRTRRTTRAEKSPPLRFRDVEDSDDDYKEENGDTVASLKELVTLVKELKKTID
ncbi:hypothetical protein AYL99_10200 [Fonsecaea erecta]|uniref:Uncharacterized protein n=1 Tax=Fonsecaea erecta TaxID=1367422 RepID=A0A178Z8C8_9EURO|nr:hypothetical protein AYL99_10200 [Fonsecaea erecta]OAP56048.1 hypothetical protein AYL99_10200 [Fonsecaea erecta]